ncbi:MAG: phytoene desaturase family protein [Bryobacterales bacterium]|nr:phytoene desaturase family protein [Bryobacterales bacterium]
MPKALPEVIVIGAGLGGLSAAIHLRLAGHPVRIFEANGSAGGRANLLMLEGLPFDTGPTLLNYPWIFRDLFHAAGERLEDFVELRRVEPTLTFYWPDGWRLRLSAQRELLAAELASLEPSAGRSLDRFLADAGAKFRLAFEKLIPRDEPSPLRYFAALKLREWLTAALWRSMYAELARFFRSRYVLEALGSYAMYLGGSPFRLPGIFTLLPYGELAHGLWYPRGGVYALIAAIETLARGLGIEIHYGQKVSRILARNGRVHAVELADGTRVPAPIAVCNMDLPEAFPRLLGEPPPRSAMSPAVLTFYWVVRRLPEQLGHHTIFLPEHYRRAFWELLYGRGIPSQLAFYVSAPDRQEPRPTATTCARLFVLIPLPTLSSLGPVNWPETIARLRLHVLERLAAAGSSFRESEILAEQVWTPADWSRRFCLHDGSAFGAAHTLLQVGPFRSPNFSRRHRGLYFVGASTIPGTGLPMVVLSGRLVAQRVSAHVR